MVLYFQLKRIFVVWMCCWSQFKIPISVFLYQTNSPQQPQMTQSITAILALSWPSLLFSLLVPAGLCPAGHRAQEAKYEVPPLFRDSLIVLTLFVVLIFNMSDTVIVKTWQKREDRFLHRSIKKIGSDVLQTVVSSNECSARWGAILLIAWWKWRAVC